jgi:N-hydroxyarylamine O-acetyltransferase
MELHAASAYLHRLGVRGPVPPTAKTLHQLHEAHLLAVPFENLSIHWQEPIVLSDDALFEKIVVRRRGGFCYELNGLFAALLRSLGFNVTMLSAEVADDRGEFGPPFDHLALAVMLEDVWLADVGFGDSFREPLMLDYRGEQTQGDDVFRIHALGEQLVVSRRNERADWRAQYRFTLAPHHYADYEEMCRYHQTSPHSHFTQQRICSRATTDGRISVTPRRLIRTRGRVREESELATEAEYTNALRELFGIIPPAPA